MSEPGAPPLLQLYKLTKRYDAAVPGAQGPLIFENLNLEMARGETIAIVGPSGCGKSTLLNLIGTLDRSTSGQIIFDGEDIAQWPDAKRAAFRNRELGFVFQEHHLLPQCSLLENVLVPTLAPGSKGKHGLHGSLARERAEYLLARVGLSDRLAHRPAQLSGGERQRVAVVRALINGPRLLLADEPTGSLDQAGAANLADLLVELNREEGVSLMVVTHAPTIAARFSRVLELDGRLRPLSLEKDSGRS